MNSIIVFGIVFGGAGVLIFVFFMIKTVIRPKKLHSIEQLIDAGNTKAAIRQAKTLLSRNEKNPDAHWFLGECYRAENRPDLAVVEYKYITNTGRFTNNATKKRVRSRLAEEYLKLGQIDESQKEYILLSKIEPDNYETYYQIAKLFEERNYTDSALTNYKKTISLNPKHAQSYHRMGVIYFKKQVLNEAKRAFLTALKLDSQNYSSFYYLGKISKASGDSTGALTQFDKASKDPDIKQRALLEKANIYATKGDLGHAISDLERAMKLGENDVPAVIAIRYLLARCYEVNKDLVKAIEQWEWVYKKDPKFGDVAEKLALYSDLRSDDTLKDFFTASQSKFQEYCIKIVQSLGLTIQDVYLKGQDLIEMNALEIQSKWRNAKKAPSVIRIFRSAEPISYDAIRGLYDQMRKINATRSICITASKFTRTAVEFAQIRPIDLIDKEELIKLLHKI